MVNNARDAGAAVRACRYPADGGERGFATRRATGYGRVPIPQYLEFSKQEPLVIIQIEHKNAVDNIDSILRVPGIGSVCVGPFDLSASYGKTAQFNDPDVSAAIDKVMEKTLNAGILLGGFCNGPFWKNRFMNWKALVCDFDAMFQCFRSLIEVNAEARCVSPRRVVV
jgi:2-keto-3-deoxy-L-rhamnonate aldolase RhmA